MIVSTTLVGNNVDIVADALRSVVDWVDLCLVIDTGSTDGTLEVARSIAGAKYVERKFPWINDFAAARNFALAVATELGANWAITVDTDERIMPNGEDLRSVLRNCTEGVVMMSDSERTYAKERCFRLPSPSRFDGPTHEVFPSHDAAFFTFVSALFHELPKSPDGYRAKFERDAEILITHSAAHPHDPRWHYYLGDAFQSLGRLPEAIAAYDACALLWGWDEESAWACYRSAECLLTLGRHREALDRCAGGLARHAGVAELAWLAAVVTYDLGNAPQAVYWARLAITHGLFRGDGACVPRIGFRNRNALFEGPFDILRFALRALGDTAGADAAERAYHEAIAARESTG